MSKKTGTRKSRRNIFPPYFHIFLAHVCEISRDFVTPTRAIFAMRSSVIALPGNRRFRCTLALGPITLGTRAIYGEKGLSRRYVRFIAPQNLSVQSATSIKEKKSYDILFVPLGLPYNHRSIHCAFRVHRTQRLAKVFEQLFILEKICTLK